jgi:hypothetical protein
MAWHVQHIPPEAKRAQEERSHRPAHDPSHLDGETDRRQFLLLAAIVYHFSPKGVLAAGAVSAAPAGSPDARALGTGAKRDAAQPQVGQNALNEEPVQVELSARAQLYLHA